MKTVFYTWQSDLSPKTNRNVIEKAINSAIKRKNKNIDEPQEQYVLDKDTLNEPGSPDIVETIIKKINACSLFVGDLSAIAISSSGKAMPNPNALFESGYFVGLRGFERAIFTFNNAYASVETLPFDLKTKRILRYTLAEKDLADAEGKSNVVKALSSAIYKNLQLIEDLPAIERPNSEIATAEIKRERDLIKLRRFLENTPIKVIQNHVQYGFESLTMDFNALTALYNMQAVQGFIGFKLYDKKLKDKVDALVSAFDKSLSFSHNFNYIRNDTLRFHPNKKVTKDDYLQVLHRLDLALKSFVEHVHEYYVEIDIETYNRIAVTAFLKEIKEEIEG